MKNVYFRVLIVFMTLMTAYSVQAQCPMPTDNFKNFSTFDVTPTALGETFFDDKNWGAGDYWKLDVVAGDKYVVTTCGLGNIYDASKLNIATPVVHFDPQIAIYQDVDNADDVTSADDVLIAFNDDHEGVFSEVSFTPNFTGKVFIVMDGSSPLDGRNLGPCNYFAVDSIRMKVFWLENTPPFTGTVTISGTTTFGEDLTASVTGSNNTGTLGYQWKRDDVNIDGATASTYTLVEADIATSISVEVTSSVETGSISSSGTTAIGKAVQAAPAQPTAVSKTHNSITLDVVAGCEYAIDGGAWQASAEFTGLDANTQYSLTQRLAETATHNASDASTGLDVSTDVATSIKDGVSGEELKIYPNPTSDRLTISNIKKGSNLSLFNSVGNLVFQQEISGTELTINVGDFDKGIYFIKVGSNTARVVIK